MVEVTLRSDRERERERERGGESDGKKGYRDRGDKEEKRER